MHLLRDARRVNCLALAPTEWVCWKCVGIIFIKANKFFVFFSLFKELKAS
jgi:hypothetical protein